MKKLKLLILIPIFLLGVFTSTLFSQGVYVEVNAGYNTALGAQNMMGFLNTTYSENTSTREQVDISLGKGFNGGVAVGYMFTKKVGAEIDVSYLFGEKTTATYSEHSSGYYYDYSYESKNSMSSEMLRFNPSIVFDAGMEGFSPYAKFGVILGTGSIIMEYESESEGDYYSSDFYGKIKNNGGLAFGLNATLGASVGINNNLAFFGELNMINMSYAPTKGEIIEYMVDGEDRLDEMTDNEKKVEYVNKVTYDYSDPHDPSEIQKELKQKYPFGSVGINVGLRMTFGAKKGEVVPTSN